MNLQLKNRGYSKLYANVEYNNLIVAQATREEIVNNSNTNLVNSSYIDITNTYTVKAKEALVELEQLNQKINFYV